MAEYTQQNRILSFTSPLGPDTLLAIRFTGAEEISELFDYQVDLYADPLTTIGPSVLIGKRATLSLQVTDSGTQRYFNGIVASLDSLGGDSFFHTYRVRMVPALWLLSLNKQTRVFQDKSVLDILREVLAPYSIVPRIETQLEGREQIFINAERDYDVHVEHDAHALIGHQEHRTVTEDQYHSVGGTAVLQMKGDRTVQVKGVSSETVMGARSEKVAGIYSLEVAEIQSSKTGVIHSITAGEEIDLNAGARIVIEAFGSICL